MFGLTHDADGKYKAKFLIRKSHFMVKECKTRSFCKISGLSCRKIAKMIGCIIKAAQSKIMMDKLLNWFVLIDSKLRNIKIEYYSSTYS